MHYIGELCWAIKSRLHYVRAMLQHKLSNMRMRVLYFRIKHKLY